MLTKLTVKNFKRLGEVEISLGNAVVFIGPNDSGKTTALQALTLWNIGLRRWNEKRKGKQIPKDRSSVAINRRDLIYIPVPHATLLWRNQNVRKGTHSAGKQKTENILIDIIVEGVSQGHEWKCGLEFDYANKESFYCRPLRLSEGLKPKRMDIPSEASAVSIALLPPMSGLAAQEDLLQPGSINVRLGEGRTADILRNLCYQIYTDTPELWKQLCGQMQSLFGVQLEEPLYVKERGEIRMNYRDKNKCQLDLLCSGRGMQQTLLLLSYLAVNRRAVLLLDEPDAHLEILRQRQIYQVLTEVAKEQNNQIIAASHSEVILNEAADRDVVVAFTGKPHRIDDRGSQVLKSLKEIGFDAYYQAEKTGWVLYLEGSTDLAILLSFARVLKHPAKDLLEGPFVKWVQNQPSEAHNHFYGLRDAYKNLVGLALFDRLEQELDNKPSLKQHMWKKREIENYLCQKNTLLRWAEAEGGQQGLFAKVWKDTMRDVIQEIEQALKTLNKSPWSADIKASDEFLDPLFRRFYGELKLPNLMAKSDYHSLAPYVEEYDIDAEVKNVLDEIVSTARRAKPVPEI